MRESWQLPDRLEGPVLIAARTTWLVLAAGLIVLVMAGFTRAYSDPTAMSMSAFSDLFDRLNVGDALAISVALVSPYIAMVTVIVFVFVRRSDDPMALLLTATMLVFFSYSVRSLITFEGVPVLEHALSATFALGSVLLMVFLGLFPNGRPMPRRVLWLAVVMAAILLLYPDMGSLLMELLEGTAVMTGRAVVAVVLWTAVILVGFVAQVYRYWNISSKIERQQTKWAIAPSGLSLIIIITALVISVVIPDERLRWTVWILPITIPLNILIPIGMANSVMRHRLYEIDRLITRTVTYTLVGGLLMATFFAVVTLATLVVPASDDVAVAASTLTVAAVFNPLRRRVQARVEHRFNRSKYEAQRLIDSFAMTLQGRSDVDGLTQDLLAVVSQAMEPSVAGVWVNVKPGRIG